MAEFEITCRDIVVRQTLSGGQSSYMGTFGVKRVDGSVELVKQAVLLTRVHGGEKFFVERNGFKAYVEAFVNEHGDEWLRTTPDDIPVNNLRGLPACTDADGNLVPPGDGSGIDHDGGDVDAGGGGSDGGGDDG